MKEEQISAGYTVVLQAILSFYTVTFLGTIVFMLRNMTLDATGLIFMWGIIILIIIFARQLFSFADVYVSSDQIIYKKLFYIKSQPLSTIRSVNDGLLPIHYYVEFKNDKKVYFQVKPSDFFKSFSDTNSDIILESLRRKLKLE